MDRETADGLWLFARSSEGRSRGAATYKRAPRGGYEAIFLTIAMLPTLAVATPFENNSNE